VTKPIELRADGPHSAEYTMQVAYVLDDAARVLNHATMPGAGGLDYPGDAYRLLGALYTATERLPQLFAQLTAFLESQRDAGNLADDNGRNATGQVALAAFRLAKAIQAAATLTDELQAAQNAISGLYIREAGVTHEKGTEDGSGDNRGPRG